MEVEGTRGSSIGGKGGSAAVNDSTGLRRGRGNGGGIYGHSLGDLPIAVTTTDTHSVGHLIVASLCVGVAHGLPRTGLSVTEVPLVTGDLLSVGCCGCACELGRIAFADRGVGEIRGGLAVYGNGLGDLVGAVPVAVRDGKRHLVGAGLRIGVAYVLSCPSLSIAKVPLVAFDLLSTGVGGGGAGELGRVALANCREIEIGSGVRIDNDFGGGTVRCTTYGDGAGVSTSHI